MATDELDLLDATDELALLETTDELATDELALLDTTLLTTELALLDITLLALDLLDATELELLAGTVALGFLPTKYRFGAAGIAMPLPIKKLVCGGWL